jgi:DNA processing protein
MTTVLHPDGLTAVLLCSALSLPRGDPNTVKPLSAAQWRSLVEKIRSSPLQRPSDLLGMGAAEIEQAVAIKPESAERIARLLDRGGQAAFELERLAGLGIWVLTEGDDDYPTALSDRLAERAPPVLFGAGRRSLLWGSAIALAGSRDLDAPGEAFARAFAARCAAEGVTVISGGARGADRVSTAGALEAGGTAIVVLADSLQRTLRDAETGRAIRDQRLTMVTPFDPAAGFSVGNAMARNKVIYGLARLAVVVASAVETGGTWAGAIENLTRRWVPLFVRAGAGVPEGNQHLIERGGLPITLDALPDRGHLLDGLLDRAAPPAAAAPPAGDVRSPDGGPPHAPGDLFETVWPKLAAFVVQPRSEQDVIAFFGLEKGQARAWLQRAVDEGRLEYPPGRPRRYRPVRSRLL